MHRKVSLMAPWAPLKHVLVALARFSGALGRSWGALERSWGALGALLGALGRLLDASWTQLGKNLVVINLLGLNLEAKIHSSWLQNP